MPEAKNSVRAGVSWVQKPRSGKLTGNLFLDGSAMHSRWPGCGRAGWGVVQLSDQGWLTAAAYGPVPEDEAPQQQARDGEDYAAFMLTLLAEPPSKVYVDCSGTVGCLTAPPAFSRGAANERAHLWTRFWAAYDSGDFECVKTKARTSLMDVEKGVTTHWQRKGNMLADKYAKLGARDHGLTDEHMDMYSGLRSLAVEAARWAGDQEANMASAGMADASPLEAGAARIWSRPTVQWGRALSPAFFPWKMSTPAPRSCTVTSL